MKKPGLCFHKPGQIVEAAGIAPASRLTQHITEYAVTKCDQRAGRNMAGRARHSASWSQAGIACRLPSGTRSWNWCGLLRNSGGVRPPTCVVRFPANLRRCLPACGFQPVGHASISKSIRVRPAKAVLEARPAPAQAGSTPSAAVWLQPGSAASTSGHFPAAARSPRGSLRSALSRRTSPAFRNAVYGWLSLRAVVAGRRFNPPSRSFDAKQLDLEFEGRVGGNRGSRAAQSVGFLGGIVSLRMRPTRIPAKPTTQPRMVPSPSRAIRKGLLRWRVLSNILPLERVPT